MSVSARMLFINSEFKQRTLSTPSTMEGYGIAEENNPSRPKALYCDNLSD